MLAAPKDTTDINNGDPPSFAPKWSSSLSEVIMASPVIELRKERRPVSLFL
jgi:hypothetical protein